MSRGPPGWGNIQDRRRGSLSSKTRRVLPIVLPVERRENDHAHPFADIWDLRKAAFFFEGAVLAATSPCQSGKARPRSQGRCDVSTPVTICNNLRMMATRICLGALPRACSCSAQAAIAGSWRHALMAHMYNVFRNCEEPIRSIFP